MRRPILAGNWKMNMTIAEATSFVRSIRRGLNNIKGVDRVLCPPFTALPALKELLQATEIGLGAQNMYWEEKAPTLVRSHPGCSRNCVSTSYWDTRSGALTLAKQTKA